MATWKQLAQMGDLEGVNILSTTNSNEADTKYLRADGDGTCSWQTVSASVGANQTGIESIKNTSLVVGRDDDNLIKFSTDNQIIFEVSGGDNVIFKASGEIEATSLDISGDTDIDGTVTTGALTSTASTIENSASALLKISTTSGDGDSVASITFKNDNNTDGSDNNEVAHIGVRDNEDTLRFMVLSNGSPTYSNFGSYSRFMIYANGNVQGTTANGAKFFLCDAGGEYIYGTGDSLIHIAGSSLYLHAQSENAIWDGSQFFPNTDNAKNLGHGSYRWNDIYATNSTIQTSDLNLKESVADTDLGLAFINKLKPKSYKWKTTPEQKYETAEESLSPDPEPTGPDKETGDVKQSAITHKRKHYGLIAQDVKSTLDELEISTDDFAGYIKPETGSLGLRYQEFIAPLIKAVQELSSKVEALENA